MIESSKVLYVFETVFKMNSELAFSLNRSFNFDSFLQKTQRIVSIKMKKTWLIVTKDGVNLTPSMRTCQTHMIFIIDSSNIKETNNLS